MKSWFGSFGSFNRDPNTGEYSWVPPERSSGGGERRPRKAHSRAASLGISLAITLVFGFVYFYFKLPAINIHSGELYLFIILLCAVYCACALVLSGFSASGVRGYVSEARKKAAIPFYIICLCLAVAVVGSLIGWKVFRARDYAALLPVEDGDFAADVAEISFDQIPMLDSASANVLANRKLGELSELVSQFEVYSDSFQINYQNRPVRVTYLNYGDFFKWWNNQKEGIPAYMVIDMVTQEVTVQKLQEGIRYSPSEYFFRDIDRYLRFKYPTKMFTDVNFEVNEDGEPYWVATVVTRKVGLFGGEDAIGAVLVNAVTGESTYYDVADVPQWVDRVYTAELILEQYNYRGLYNGGFWNSLFGQSGCTEATSQYNYIAQDDDVWLYTGITSVTGDRGNIGFILVNQRTKEANYYPCAGAEESSAMASAMGAVQQYEYQATSPLLLNIGGQPTYFMALKDASQLVKMYAMVNVQQYNVVATGTSVSSCIENYEQLLAENGINIEGGVSVDTDEIEGVIEDIRSSVINGNSVYYIRLEGSDAYYSLSAADCPEAVILNVGDRVSIHASRSKGAIIPASGLELA